MHAVAGLAEAPVSWSVLGHTLIVLADAHIGASSAAPEEALLSFLDAVPSMGDCLLVDGDLFHFWFAYRRVIPRGAFPVAARIASLARTLPVAIVGGNHDRWGGAFWAEQRGVIFGRRELRFDVGARRVRAMHGDGLARKAGLRPLTQRAVAHPLTSALYQLLHPDLGFRIVEAVAPLIGGAPPTPAERRRKAEAQRAWAEAALADDPATDLLILGHTHEPAQAEFPAAKCYLNPGAWAEGMRYAVAGETSAELREYRPA